MKDAPTLWVVRLCAIVWFLLLIGAILSLPVLIDISGLAVLVVALIAILFAFPIAWTLRRIFPGRRVGGWRSALVQAGLAIFAVLSILVATPIYVLAITGAVRPLTVPLATLSNGQKTVVFQGMSHIGTEAFYKSVVYDLERALTEGYVIFYEGVRRDPSGDAWFDATMAGGGDLSANYTAMGRICGLTFQLDYFKVLTGDITAHPERHVAADVSTADMKREYERLIRTDPTFADYARSAEAKAKREEGSGANWANFMAWVDRSSPGQKALIGTACRGAFNIILSREDPSPIDRVVVDYRNRELAARIAASPSDKIYITYGAGHLPGLLRDLKANDPAWEIKSIKWERTIDAPENLTGRLE